MLTFSIERISFRSHVKLFCIFLFFSTKFLFRSTNEFSIESQRFDGTNRKLIMHDRDHCHGIAYDWIGNNIFWASSTKIEVFSVANPTLRKTLINTVNAG